MISSSAGIFGVVGLSAMVLGVLAVNGSSPVILSLIALLALGSVTASNGIDLADPYWTYVGAREDRAVSAD
jgi:hypothetical protein